MKLSIGLVLFFAWSCSWVTASGQDTLARDILNRSATALKNISSHVYDANYQIKFFDSEDTLVYPGYRCEVLKVPDDTVLSYYAKVQVDDVVRVYDGSDFSIIGHNSKKVLTDKPMRTGKNFTRNNIKSELIPRFLYSKTPFSWLIQNGFNWIVSEIEPGGKAAWRIEYDLPTNEEITMNHGMLTIDRHSLMPTEWEKNAAFMSIQTEYNKLTLSYLYPAKELDADHFDALDYPSDYEVEIIPPPQKGVDPLAKGDAFIEFEALDSNGNKVNVDLKSEPGKLLLLDFWYLGCAPCVRAMPELEKLARTHGEDDLKILGLNPIDHPARKSVQISQLQNTLGITYPFLFIDRMVSEKYLVSSYPTLYLFHKGTLAFSKYGYDGDFSALEEIIAELLKD